MGVRNPNLGCTGQVFVLEIYYYQQNLNEKRYGDILNLEIFSIKEMKRSPNFNSFKSIIHFNHVCARQ